MSVDTQEKTESTDWMGLWYKEYVKRLHNKKQLEATDDAYLRWYINRYSGVPSLKETCNNFTLVLKYRETRKKS
jgi:hypothetical protein